MGARREARGGTLIVGGGYAGSVVAQRLGRRGCTIVSPENFLLFAPLLPEAASGTLEPRHVVVPIRQMCPHAEFVLGRVTGIDSDERTVSVETDAGSLRFGWQRLVIAVGSVARTAPVLGLAEHARGFKDLADAIALRNHVLHRLELAEGAQDGEVVRRHLTFVFVGGGYAGVEALAELADLVHDALPYYPRLRETPSRWVLVEAAPTILSEIPTTLGTYAARELARRGIEIRTETTLASVDHSGVTLSDGGRIETSTLVWTAGVKANPVLREWRLPLDERGRVRVDGLFRVHGSSGMFALGDCAAVPNAATPGRVDPPTSQHALRQARQLAANLGGRPRPYRYRMLGQVATLGRHKGIADVLGLRLYGLPGWFVTRTYHLHQLPLLPRKARVVTDWTVALFFRRDTASLSMLGHPRRLDD
jgi:NADH dehydrogenase